MEESYLVETPPPTGPTSCTDELTRSNSDASSLTAVDAEDIFQLSANASPYKCAAWTNEKHNLYLNLLEASFVKQLQQSMGLPARCSEQNKNARNLSTKQPANYALKQFTVLQEDCRQKINFGKTTLVSSNDVLKSPWIKHFKHAGRPCSTGSVDHQECCRIPREENSLREQRIFPHRRGRHPEHLPVKYAYNGDSVGSVAEGSGQNFMDNDSEDDSRSQTKKLKTVVADDSSDDDQIVPSWKLHAKNTPEV